MFDDILRKLTMAASSGKLGSFMHPAIAFSQLIILFCGDLPVAYGAINCTINGKDFSKIEKFSPWMVVSDDGNTTYKIHLCGQLSGEPSESPGSKCNSRASMCMIRGGDAWSIADYNASVAYEQSYAKNNDSKEFWIIRKGDRCPDDSAENLTTVINVKCGENLGSPAFLDYMLCTSYFEWRTNLACNMPVSDKEVKCAVFDKTGKRDLSALMKSKGGYLVDSTQGWDFYINVCRDITPDGTTSSCPAGTAACHRSSNVSEDFGWPHKQLQINSKGNLELIYTTNTKPSKCTTNPMTTIEFICPDVGGSEDPKLVFQFNCQFRVEWKTEYACPEKSVSAKNTCVLKQEDRNIDFDLTPLSNPPGAKKYEDYSSAAGGPYRYFLNICDKLGMSCPYENSNKYTAVCQTKVSNSDYAHVLGRYDHTILRYVDRELTLTLRGGDACHTNFQRTTVISFTCNQTAENNGKGYPRFDREESCTYFFDWDTKYACLDHPVDQSCRVNYKGRRYDLSPLVRTFGKNWDVLDGGTDSKRLRLFHINVCNDIILENARRCKSDSSVCLIDENGAHSLGRYTSSSNPTFDPSTNTITLTYYRGDSCGTNQQKKSIITLICNPGDLDSSPIFLRQSPDDCVYEFEWHTAAACVLAKKSGSNCQVFDEELGVNFDLNRLKKAVAPFYKVTSGNLDYTLNVCGDVTGTKCDSNGRNTPHPGVCQEKQGGSSSEAYNAGQVNTNLTYYDGIIKLTYKNGDNVNGSTPAVARQTQIAFLCDRHAGIGSPSFVNSSAPGVLEFEWKTEYACPNIPVECTAMANGKQYDLSSLSRKGSQGSWAIVDDSDPQHKVKYYLNVCRSLSEVKVGNGCSPFAAACRTHYVVDKEQLDDKYADLGEVTSGPTVQSEGHLMLQYHSIKPLCNDNGQMKNFTTTLNFVCKKGDLGTGPARPLKIGNCEFSFLWETEAACPIGHTETSSVRCEVKDQNSDYTFNLAPLRKKGDKDFYEVPGPQGRKFRMNICGGISSNNCDQAESANSSVCQVLANGSKPLITKYDHEELKYSDDGRLTLTYYGAYDSQGNKNEVVILFLCRQNIPFGEPKFKQIVGHSYQFDFETSLVCRPQPVDCLVQDETGTQYDLSPLAKTDKNWDVLDTRQGHMDLKYFINVCRPINPIAGSTCPGGPVGGCQVSTHGSAFNLGYIQSKPVVNGNGSLTLVYTNGDLCHKGTPREAHRSTRINFFCSSQEHSPVFQSETETCEYIFEWLTPAACPIQRVTGTSCSVTEPVYNYKFDLSLLRNTTADYQVRFGEYIYQINVCGPLVHGISECSGIGACQTKPLDKNFNFNAGKATSTLVYDAGEITLTYDGGKPCHQAKFNRSTVITFLCDQAKTGKEGPVFINETSDCTYQFEWPTKLACPPFAVEDCSVTNQKGEQFDLTSLGSTTDNLEYIDSLKKKKYIFNVCRSLVHKKKETCAFNAAACMLDLTDTNATTRYHNIGEVNAQQVVYDTRLELHYTNGEPCNDGKEKTSTRIVLLCDKTAIDSKPAGHFMVGKCEHHFVWHTRAACPLGSDIEKSGNCTVKNPRTGYEFDLSSLNSKTGYQLDDGADHLYTLNVCGSVSGTECTGSNNLGVCQTEKNGQKRKFKGGNANSNLQFDEGFIFLNYTGGDKCHLGVFERSTIINFICKESAGHGHPEFIKEEEDCTYQFYWYTSLACEKQVKCSVDINNTYSIDLSPLIKQSGHHTAITTSSSGAPPGSILYINVCRPLNPVHGSLCPPGSSACMTVEGQMPRGLGKTNSPPQVDASSGKITLVYDHGSQCVKDRSKNISSKIIFNCKKGLSQGSPVLEQITDDCQYVFQWDTSVVCRDEEQVSGGTNCLYTDKATHAVYNLTQLRTGSPHTVTRNGLKYFVNLCGTSGFANKGCEASPICRVSGSAGFGYGKTANSMFVKSEDTLKLIYTDDTGCNGSKSEGIIIFRCDKDVYPGKPTDIFVGPCKAIFDWKTRAVCPSIADQCVMSYNGQEYDLRILSNQKSSWMLKDSSGNSYWINVCQGIHNSPNSDLCLPMSSACRKTNGGEISSLGLVTTQTMHMDHDGKTIVVEYYSNDSVCTSGKSSNRATKTIIKFVCGKTIGGPVFVSSSNKPDNCVFEFKWVTSAACQLSEMVVTEKDGIVHDPRSGGIFNLTSLKGQQFTTVDRKYAISLDGGIEDCPGAIICDAENKDPLAKSTDVTYYAEDDILEAWYMSDKTCTRDKSKKNKVIIRFQCNEKNGDPIYEWESMDCVMVFSWDSVAGCSSPNVVVPQPASGGQGTTSQGGGTGGKGKTIATIVSVFLVAIIICVLLIVFHKKERREAVMDRLRRMVSRSGYSSLPQNDLEANEDDDLLSHITAQDLDLQGSVQTDNDEVNILSRESEQRIETYHDDSDEELLS